MASALARVLGAGAAALVLATVLVVALGNDSSGDRTPRPSTPLGTVGDPAHEAPASIRTVLVSATMPAPSEPGLVLHAQLREGRVPGSRTPAVVVSDEDCAPDSAGISRCRNVVRLDSGATIVLRHPHDMSVVPCLTPGEPIVVQRAV